MNKPSQEDIGPESVESFRQNTKRSRQTERRTLHSGMNEYWESLNDNDT